MHPTSLQILEDVFGAMDGVTHYLLGAKPELDVEPNTVKVSDCSGFVRLAVYKASGAAIELPEGSVTQREWCEQNGLHKLDQYSDVQYASSDDHRLFICFIVANETEKIGHVWFVRSGVTMECYGGHGVGSRAWDTAILKDNASYAFELVTE